MNVLTKDSPNYGDDVRRGLPNTWKSRARKEGDYKKEMLRIGKLAQKLLDEEYHGKKETSKLFEQERFWVAFLDIRFSHYYGRRQGSRVSLHFRNRAVGYAARVILRWSRVRSPIGVTTGFIIFW